MSLVDALQVSPARSRKMKMLGGGSSRPFCSPKMNGGIRVEVTLLDGRKLEFSVGTRLLTQELVALVASHFSLRDSHYLSLAYKDAAGHNHWLIEDCKLIEHDFARGVRLLPLHFLVKFFPPNIANLADVDAVEMIYLQARNLVLKKELPVESAVVFRLAAYAIQAAYGDYLSESQTKSSLEKLHLIPSTTLEEYSLNHCAEKICEHHRNLLGLSRGDAILSYMKEIESVPSYGVHFYGVRDRANLPWYLGINQKGIAQYDFLDRTKPKRVFLWKQLENLYLRERKFSIEVHDPKRIVHTLNSFNLYEGAIEDWPRCAEDDLLKAITEDTTQVSVSRRTFGPGNVCVYVWFAECQSLCKSIWSMAIAQHQFYLDRKTSKPKDGILSGGETLDLAGELSRSCLSLSTHSSPNLSRSGSHSSLQQNSHTDSVSTESLHAARMEMLSALQQRYDALQEKLKDKSEELKLLCLREGELTGEIPPEYPIKPGEPPPVVRKRVGTSFTLDEALISKIISKQEETVASLELEHEIQAKITSAALRLANESFSKKGLRKQRKQYYQQALQRLKDIELKLKAARNRQAQILASNSSTMPKMKKKPRPVSDGEAIHDDSYLGLGNASISQDCLKETSFIDGIPLSPPTNTGANGSYPLMSPTVNHLSCHLKSKISSTLALHSAPPSPQRGSSVGPTPSESSSSHPTISEGSRSSSPGRPTSGYIPSCVYTLSEYRTQHYPTLSTRSQSGMSPSQAGLGDHEHHRSLSETTFTNNNTSLNSHSLDNLDSSMTTSSPTILPKNTSHHLYHPHRMSQQHSSSTSSVPQHPSTNSSLPQQPLNNMTPHPYPFHHHHHSNHHNYHHRSRRQRNSESQDRYGSLDRRRAASGRLESRSLEHLDSSVPPPSPHPPNISHPSSNACQPLEYTFPYEPQEGQVYPVSLTNYSFETSSTELSFDTVDSVRSYSDKYKFSAPNELDTPNNRVANRVVSARAIDTLGHSITYNQENIPPTLSTDPPSHRRPTTPHHRYTPKGDIHTTHLRPTASVNAADHVRPYRIPATDLPPLRATKSSVDLPPLKPTNPRLEVPTDTPVLAQNATRSDARPTRNNAVPPINGLPTVNNFHTPVSSRGGSLTEPLMSLAEAANLKKLQTPRNREWHSHESDTPKECLTSHNLSTSSIGSSGSSGSVFHSTTDGNESLNATLTIESPCNHMIITTGTFQPSREVSKPFEMSDFYKYSTKFRRQSAGGGSLTPGTNGGGGSSDVSTSGSESPLGPKRGIAISTSSIANIHPPPPSPSLVAQHSSPAPQQKGIYQPLTPLTCHPVDSSRSSSSSASNNELQPTWENSPVHQAVPINVTQKRSATLV